MNNNDNQGNPGVATNYGYPSIYAQPNVINLPDVWRILIKHKKIVLISLLTSIVLGLGYALLRPVIYSFSTTVQIGTVSSEGKTELIESTETALNKILSAYTPFVLSQFYEKNPGSRGRFRINVSVPKDSDILIIEAKDELKQEAAYKILINDLVNKLIEDHSRIANIKIKNLEVSITHAENLLASSKDGAKLITANIKRLDTTSDLLRAQLTEKKQLLANTLKNRNNVKGNNAAGAMSVLLIDSEIQRYQTVIDELEKELVIDINKQRNELDKSLSDNLRDQTDRQNHIDQLKNHLANISNTKAVVPVMTSSEPVGIGKTMIVLAAILLGLFVGVIASLLFEFFQNLMQNNKTSTEG